MTPTRRRNYQRRYGRAQRALNALDMGLVRPEQLEKTPSQLQRTVQRLIANPIITTGRSNEQQEPAQPRRSVFSRMATRDVSLSPKRPVQGSNRLEAFSVRSFQEKKVLQEKVVPIKPEVALHVTRPEFKRSSSPAVKAPVRRQ